MRKRAITIETKPLAETGAFAFVPAVGVESRLSTLGRRQVSTTRGNGERGLAIAEVQ